MSGSKILVSAIFGAFVIWPTFVPVSNAKEGAFCSLARFDGNWVVNCHGTFRYEGSARRLEILEIDINMDGHVDYSFNEYFSYIPDNVDSYSRVISRFSACFSVELESMCPVYGSTANSLPAADGLGSLSPDLASSWSWQGLKNSFSDEVFVLPNLFLGRFISNELEFFVFRHEMFNSMQIGDRQLWVGIVGDNIDG